MKRKLIVSLVVMFALACFAGTALAKSAGGKVVSVEGDKVTVQMDAGKGSLFPSGSMGVEIKGGSGQVRGKVVSQSGDKVTVQVKKGKASNVSAGKGVTLNMADGGEELQGC